MMMRRFSEIMSIINKHEGVYEFMWVDERPLDLTEQEEKDFKKLIIYGFNKLNHGSDESKSDY